MKTHTGFTLIEVLIAMLVLAIGLMGLATLQTYSLRANLSAYTRGQATQLLYDMSDRMRANSGTARTSTATTGYLIDNTLTNSRTASKTLDGTHACRTPANTTCTNTILADYDLIEWSNTIAATLPMGRACITSTDNSVFTLYITWDDNRSGSVVTDTNLTACTTITTYNSTEKTPDPVLTMSVQL
jgi:type IV pilus assembly protein PilV